MLVRCTADISLCRECGQYYTLGYVVLVCARSTVDGGRAITTVSVIVLVHGQVTIIFIVSVCLSVCLFVQSFSQPSLIRFRSSLDICYMSGSSCVP